MTRRHVSSLTTPATLSTPISLGRCGRKPWPPHLTPVAQCGSTETWNWPLLTGTPANLATLWKFFGIFYQVVPEDQPPKIDWYTHTPLTYDVAHSDGFILLDAHGNERFITVAPPQLHGNLKSPLKDLLNDQGIHNLNHQQSPNWTVSKALTALGWLAGRNLPAISG